ncbi:invasin domain 3-containing protein (plasmid) [Hafnia alvei]|uniref:invasin domain 3-containing protein n=4 Tax=Hafnia alvei TaxID=569 RepID=UPI0028BEF734|nr:invasin domain 3-containing protein [Hafnia alvei]WNN54752.1 invasin domain 3-containing protein [Hafnia alvei]
MFSKLRLRKGIAYLLIWLQLLTPGLSMLPMVARASEPADMQSTVQGLNALILGNEAPAPKVSAPSVTPSQAPTTSAPASSSRLSDYFHVQAPVATPAPETGLPSLTSPKSSTDKAGADESATSSTRGDEGDNRLASGAMQMGSLLSQDNTSDAAINYARSIGEGLINQQVNDWLNQYGNAKVSLGTHQNLSGDILVPVYETDQNLVFSQVGARTNQDRNTVNLGFGYRQYLNDWMLGINTFYDYDYTGKNKRIGVGTEAWTDYLKLAANGYIRQTNWHQSKLDDMEDYDERPANGFDLRANAYLPSWPNWGGSLKYEQYFGKGVSVAESASPDSLKDNPVVVTAGVDYTPFPLMTLSAKRSIGDSNETNVGLDFTYRFGVPWEQQIDPDSVGLMRSLVGSKYDFVDRNYNIVMQYRKQELLTISLPAATTAQAAETVPVILTVSKAKYGLKSVSWNVDATLTARGGRYQQVSPTELRVTLPAYVFGQRTNAAQNYKISAVATDNNGNQSNTAETLIGVIPSENTVSNLTISPSDKSLPVDASKGYTITGLVTDGKGVPLVNQSVTFSINGLVDENGHSGATLSSLDGKLTDSSKITVTTLANGKATVLLRSTVAGQGTITATMDNGNANSGKVSFIADTTTAAVTALVTEDDNATADGKATNSVLITVKDKFGNPVNGADVYLTASNEAKIVNKVATNAQGSAKVTLTSTKAGPSTVAASLNDSQKEVTVTFGVGKPDQDKSGISTDKSDYVAGDDIAVSVVLKDGQNNSISGKSGLLTDSAVTVPNAVVKSGSKWVEETQSPGTYTRHYVAKTASINQHATLNLTGWSKTSNAYNITANMKTAAVVSLEVKDNNAVADGTAKNSVIVTVEDNYQNRVTGAVVSLAASNGALIAESETTGPAGTVLVTLTNAKAGVSAVSASLNSSSKSVNVSFGVGEPVKANSSITTNKASYISGSEIQIEVTLADQKQNAVAGLNSTKLNSMVTVANAEAKSTTNWVESSTAGRYVGTYVAKVSGENLTATLKISDGNTASEMYAITAGEAVLANSSITRDSASYVSGTDIKVTVTLKDGNSTPNPVTGLSSATLSDMVTVANAKTKSAANWTEVADKPGTYTGLYVANTVGTGLKATLTIAGVNKSSATYAITAGEAVQAGAKIATNAGSYVAGAEMTVTVTLKDGQGNGATGQAALLTSTTVKVPNGTAKADSVWADKGDGTYSRTYIATTVGSNLKATLTLSGWTAAVESAAYAITQGSVVQAGAKIATNESSYVAGTEMMVTVTLKDGQGNGATGQAALLTSSAVTVANGTAKADGVWADNGDGTYSRTYIATTVGSNLKATLTLSGWTAATESAAYAITQGSVVQAGAKIATNAGSYVAGSEMTVTVTLKDGQGNGATGQAALLTSSAVTVANATAKADGVWADNGDGTYSRTYIATTVGSNLKATLTLSGWTATTESAAYVITQGSVVQAGAKIATNAGSYVAGTEMTVTVTLKDGQGNGATGQTALLTSSAVTVANATAKADGVWADNNDGTYSRTYIATTVGMGLKALLKLNGWTAATESAAYAITQGSVVQAGAKIATDAGSYVAGSEMTVTVTLKDGQGNGATGQKALLTSTTVGVPNATAKADSVWTDNNDGTYNRTYIANTVGSNLKATLILTGWTATTESAAYVITQGSVVQAGAKIATNAGSYVAGSEMTVTVTLKDGQGNGATGQKALLTSTTVGVPNATAKADGVWTDNNDGTYNRTYIANTVGSNLKATLILTGWTATTESAAYAITQGSVVQAGAKIATNAGSYVAGTEMTVTVTLKDGQGNGATGQAALLTSTTVKVPNATAKADSVWADNNDGTYSRTYIANTVGSNLKATLTLSGWTAESAAYAITQGSVVQAGAKIATNAGSYVAGTEMTVTVTLKDSQGNGATGQKALLTSSAVTVANATAKADGVWTDNNDGTYSRTYIATTVGSNLKATLTLSGWTAAVESAAYAITQGSVVQAGAKIATNAGSYVAGAEMMVTVTLKDGQGNGATGQAALLTSSAVTVANATAKADGVWADNGDGTYSRTYIATTVGTGLKALLKLNGWTAATESAAYAITQGSVVQAGAKIATNAGSYVAGTEMTVTVTLKDGQGNGATGQAALLTSTTVKVPNGTAKADSVWADNNDGTYSRTYIANTVGSNLKATVKLSGWTAESESAAYAITQGSVVQAGAKIATNAGSYVAGAEMTVTVTLKDGQGNGATGQKATLTAQDTTLTVANATAKADSVWADNNDGTYSRTYIATTVGSNLKATLTLSGWTAAVESAAYAITQGSVVQAGAKIATNAGSYVAGAEMTVTVTLKDAQGNGTTGQAALLTSSAVTVANATAKADSVWADNGDGTYSRTYIANTVGSNLAASLKLSNWSTAVSSSAYAITQGSVVQAGAKIATNAGSYVAGTEMTVTVTLKDGQGNGATGQTAQLTSTTVGVPNATAKADSVWTDNNDGTYSRTYIATTVGSNLKATLTLSGWTATTESAAYTITQGSVVQAGAKIATNAGSYVAGAEMTVTVTLKDAQGNGTTGQTALLTSSAVTVANATAKADSVWTDNNDGTYSRTYIANTVGSNLKATLTLSGWTAAVESAAYAITQGSVVQAGAKIATNAGSYVAGAEMTVTVTLKDAQGNGTTGQAALLTSSAVTVANATAKADSVWADNGDGTYSRTYIANTVGSNLAASLKLSNWSTAVSSSAYAITQGSVVQAGAKIATNAGSYVAGTEMTVTVTLKDAQGNGATGQAALLTSTTVGVPNATAKADSVWTDNNDGTYSRTYIANTVGSNLAASLKLSNWSTAVSSSAYAITQGSVVQAGAKIATDESSYVAGSEMTMTVTLKDGQGNGVTGQAALLTSTTVGVPNATAKADGVWLDNNDGTYSRTYIANTVGSNLAASLKLSEWSTAVSSSAYVITQGSVVQAGAKIATNAGSYVAGTEMTVTVTLKDSQGNGATGQAALLTSTTVKLPNATAKADGVWADNNDGTYSRTYIANTVGSNLTASVKLSGWTAAVESAAYAITQGSVVQAGAKIATNESSYVAGSEMTMTVTLKDGQGNGVTGQAALLTSTTVKVPNATAKADSAWADNGDGTYNRTYIANTVGSNLKATLKLTGWTATTESAAYTITQGSVVQAGAKIATNAGSYVAGTEMTVTVTLKDAQGNGTTGQAALLTSTTVGVANATAKADSVWADNNDGTYSRTYIANTVGSNLKATLTLSGWTAATESAAYAITQGSVVQAGAKIATNAGSYVAGTEMMVTVTLKDGQGNGATGQAALLTSSAVTIANATAKADSAWTDNNDGTYSRTYIANTVGSNLKATLTLSGWTAAVESAAYAITQGSVVQAGAKIATNESSYVAGDEMTVTVTLKDGQGNGTTGQKALLTSTTVGVPNTTAKADSVWTDNNDGTYSRTYIANTVGSNLKATLKLSGWTTAAESAAYAIAPDTTNAIITASVLDNGKALTPADGKAFYEILISAKDRFGNILKSYPVTLSSPVLTEPRAISTSDNGEVTTAIASSIAGTYDVLISSTTNSSIKSTVTLKFSIDKVNIITPSL